MFFFIIKRVLYGILVTILVVLIITGIIYLAPVDPTRLTFGQRSDNATVIAKRKELGLDKPLYVQLAYYINDISPVSFHTDTPLNAEKYNYLKIIRFGESILVLKKPFLRQSYQTGRKVSDILSDAVPQTAILALSSIIIASIIGIVLGILAALKPGSWFDTSALVLSVLGYSLPSYIIAMMFALIFGYWLSAYTGLNIQGSLFEITMLEMK